MKDSTVKNIYKLSPRESEVVSLIIEGLSTSSIALKLGIKINTVSTIKKRIFLKVGVNTVVDLYKLLQD